MSPIIQCHNISKSIQKDGIQQPILPATSLEVEKGDLLAITGCSGSGKSTLLNIIGLLDQPSSGNYSLQGQRLDQLSPEAMAPIRQKSFGYIFQQYWLIKQLSIIENVQLPLYYAGKTMRESTDHCMQILDDLHIADHAHKYPHQLSGGQQQRASIARALSTDPPILLADEPSGALDQKNTGVILEILQQLNQDKQTTIVLVTHDNWVAKQCRTHIQLHDLFSKPALIENPSRFVEVAVC